MTVLGNTGSLTLAGNVFIGWNTAADYSGLSYLAGYIFNISGNTTLYAIWENPALLNVYTKLVAIDSKTTNLPAVPAAVSNIPTVAENQEGLLLLTDAAEIAGVLYDELITKPTASDIKTAIEAAGSHLTLIKAVTDLFAFTGTYVNAQVKAQDDIDFEALQKASLNAAAPSASSIASAVWGSGTRTLTSFGTLVADAATAVWAAGTRTLSSFSTLIADLWAYGQRRLSDAVNITSDGAAIDQTKIARLDVAVSTRLATIGYTAPDNADLLLIKAKTDNLTATPADKTDIPTTNITAIKTVIDKINTMLEADGSNWRLTADSLIGFPTGTGGFTATDRATLNSIEVGSDYTATLATIITHLTEIKGSGWTLETLKTIYASILSQSGLINTEMVTVQLAAQALPVIRPDHSDRTPSTGRRYRM